MRDKPWRNAPPATIMLAAVPVKRELVEHLAGEVDELTASKLAKAIENETLVLALEIDDRERILRALEDAPAGLEELRAVLLQEHVGRVRDGL